MMPVHSSVTSKGVPMELYKVEVWCKADVLETYWIDATPEEIQKIKEDVNYLWDLKPGAPEQEVDNTHSYELRRIA
jgi:hypothetical protein